MKLLYGTTNKGKLQHMRDMLDGLDIDIIGLNEIKIDIRSIDERGNNPLENARIKALAYYKATKMPVFSCDSGLFLDGLGLEEQPGVHIRRVKGKELNDEEMIQHYSNLASKLGGEVKARYKNAICLVIDEQTIYEYDGYDISSEEFIITSKVHSKKIEGFPLDAISLDVKTKRYYLDIENNDSFINQDTMTLGFRNFFMQTVLK
jgi:8-oxo-dGTP diphosphatase